MKDESSKWQPSPLVLAGQEGKGREIGKACDDVVALGRFWTFLFDFVRPPPWFFLLQLCFPLTHLKLLEQPFTSSEPGRPSGLEREKESTASQSARNSFDSARDSSFFPSLPAAIRFCTLLLSIQQVYATNQLNQ